MPWDSEQHRAAVAKIDRALDRRFAAGLAVDDHPRVVESLALENYGNDLHPRSTVPLSGKRLSRALRSARYERWATVAWRASLAQTDARSIVRRKAMADGDVETVLGLKRDRP